MRSYTPTIQATHTALDRTAIVDKRLDQIEDLDDIIRRLAHDMTRGCRSEAGTRSYTQELALYLRWCRQRGLEPLAVDEDDAHAYAADLHRYSQGSQHLKLLVARLFYKTALRRAAKWELSIDVNPFDHVVFPSRAPERITPSLTQTQVETVLAATSAEFNSPNGFVAKRDYAVIMLMVRLGLRATETASLTWGRLQRSDGAIRTSFMGKGNKPGHLFVPEDVWDVLLAWKRSVEVNLGVTVGPADPLFIGMSPHLLAIARVRKGATPLPGLNRDYIYDIVKGRLLDVGIDGDRFSPHCLRATAAVLAYRGGATILEVKALLRHSSVDTTMRYLESIMGGASRAAIDCIKLDVPAWEVDDDVA